MKITLRYSYCVDKNRMSKLNCWSFILRHHVDKNIYKNVKLYIIIFLRLAFSNINYSRKIIKKLTQEKISLKIINKHPVINIQRNRHCLLLKPSIQWNKMETYLFILNARCKNAGMALKLHISYSLKIFCNAFKI